MSKPFFKIIDYVQSSDAGQNKPPPSEEPEITHAQTHNYYQQSLTPNSTSQQRQVEISPYKRVTVSTLRKPNSVTTKLTGVQWNIPMSPVLQLTTQTDFKKMGQPRQKTKFTEQQTTVLLTFYERCQYIKADEVMTIADKTGLSIKHVRNWFNNRRAASKRNNSSISKDLRMSSK